MRPERLLHRGFDRLEIAYKAALAPADIDILEAALAEAKARFQPVLVELGPGKVPMHIAEAGLKGGYAFRGDTGPEGELWAFKRGLSRNEWNVRVAVKSLTLATLGLGGVRNRLAEMHERLGLGSPEESIGRVDYAIDYLMPAEFVLNPGHFVSHSKTTKREHACVQQQPAGLPLQQMISHWAGRVVQSITLGKMPGQQVIVYNKRHEVLQHQKPEWFQIWGVDGSDQDLPIWRVEMRAGKKYLKDWNVKTFSDLEDRVGEVLGHTLAAYRHVVPNELEKNISRWPNSKLWKQIARDLSDGLRENFDGSARGRIVTGRRERIHNQYRQLIFGALPGLLVSAGLSVEQAFSLKGDFLRKLAREADGWKGEQFRKKLMNAKKRMRFIR
ncbi:hypothetical protein [Aestuariivirga sp.]|uniref:hypothetical protein n=1 Tax=Aestuariivirga sp. TaxID=2650926 RepID=UPI0039E45194